MTRTITLPIKCSTVRKATDILWYLIIALIGSCSAIFIDTLLFHPIVDENLFLGGKMFLYLFVVISTLSIVLMCGIITIGVISVIEDLPRIECMKDEEGD